MALRIAEHACLTDVGRQRHTNEDSYYEEAPVFAVADGMGGAQAGEVASAMAVKELGATRDGGGTAEEQLAAVARAANRKIWEMAQSDSRRAGMGTTFIAAIVGEHDVAVGHVGDSRLYLLRDGNLQQLTNDHSLVEEFVRQGRLTREQAEKHPQRSVITRALGPENDVEVDTFSVPAKHDDVFLLCSDGLSTMLSDEEIQQILTASRPVKDTAKQLIEAANRNGGRDNITVVAFRLEDDGEGDTRRTDTESYDTIASDQPAPSEEQIEAERRRVSEMETQARSRPAPAGAPEPVPTGAASAVRAPARASPGPDPTLPDPAQRPRRPHAGRGRWLLRSAAAAAVVLTLAAGGLYFFSKSVWFLGTNDQGMVTLFRGLPYDLPLGIHLYRQRYVSGVPALALSKDRRRRVLDHQLRSKQDAGDLIRTLDVAASR